MKEKNQRTLAVVALIIALCSTTIAFAILQTTLTISGSITKKGGIWDITFVDVGWVAGEPLTTVPAVSGTNLNFGVKFDTPGDYVVIGLKLKNAGTIDAISSTMPTLKVGTNSGRVSDIGSWNEAITSDGVSCRLSLSNDINNIDNKNSIFNYFYKLDADVTTDYSYLMCKYDIDETTELNETFVSVSFNVQYKQN